MKTLSSHIPRRLRAFTLLEMLITMVTVCLVLAATLSSYAYGIKMTQYVNPKLGSSDEARRAVSLLMEEVRAARSLKIGNGSISSFTEVAPFSAQLGSALQLYPTVETNSYIRYFWDSGDKKLKRTTNGMTTTLVIANAVSNEMVFRAEDFAGRLMSNNFNNRVIAMELNFYQIQYPVTAVGPGNYYDFYRLRTRITRRTLL